MSRTQLGLGVINTKDRESHFNLSLKGSVSILLPDLLQGQISESSLLEALSTKQCWPIRAPNFHIKLNIKAPVLADDDISRISALSFLRSSIESAELWDQLGLRCKSPSGLIETSGETSDLRFELNFLEDNCQEQEENISSRLPSAASIRPPQINTVRRPVTVPDSIDMLCLDLRASLVESMVQRLTKRIKLTDGLTFNARLDDDINKDTIFRGSDSWQQLAHNESWEPNRDWNFGFLIRAKPDGTGIGGQSSPQTHQPEEQDEHHSLASIKQTSGGPSLARTTKNSTEVGPIFLKLFDGAFRSMICNSPLHLPTQVKVSREVVAPSLSTLIPSLFSPGYILSIAQRQQFPSVLARSLASVLRRTDNTELRSKALLIQEIDPDRQPNHSTAGPDLTTNIEIERVFWRAMVGGLYKPEAARRLSPMKPPEETSDPDAEKPLDSPKRSVAEPDEVRSETSELCLTLSGDKDNTTIDTALDTTVEPGVGVITTQENGPFYQHGPHLGRNRRISEHEPQGSNSSEEILGENDGESWPDTDGMGTVLSLVGEDPTEEMLDFGEETIQGFDDEDSDSLLQEYGDS